MEFIMSSFVLKIIAIITMFIDHLSFAYNGSFSYLNFLGRLSFPIFAFQISEGYLHTKNIKKGNIVSKKNKYKAKENNIVTGKFLTVSKGEEERIQARKKEKQTFCFKVKKIGVFPDFSTSSFFR